MISEPRRRTQIKRYGHDESVVDMSELDSSDDSDDDLGSGLTGRGMFTDRACSTCISLSIPSFLFFKTCKMFRFFYILELLTIKESKILYVKQESNLKLVI